MASAPIVLALISALGFGSADFLAGLATRRAAAIPVTFASSCAALVPIAALIVMRPGAVASNDLLEGFFAGLCGTAGFIFFYGGLGAGTMGVVAPVTGVMTTLVPLAAGLLHGERLSRLQGVGIVLALLAVALVSIDIDTKHPARLRSDVIAGLLGGVFFGLSLVALGLARPQAGMWPSLAAVCTSVITLPGVAQLARVRMSLTKEALGMSLLVGCFNVAGLVCFLLSCAGGGLSIAATLSSLSPAIVVVLSRIFLEERLRRVQILGVVTALIAVTCIAK